MKLFCAPLFTLLLVSVSQAASAAPGAAQTKLEAQQVQATQDGTALVVLPKSVFETSTQFKDPFHPRSTRRVKSESPSKSAPPPHDTEWANYLILNGLSGPANQRLAIINGKTLAVGEESEVTTERGKVKIRCLEIRTNSAIVTVGTDSAKSELRLKD